MFNESNLSKKESDQAMMMMVDEKELNGSNRYKERIEDGVWKPSIFDRFENVLGVGASTKELKRIIRGRGEAAKVRLISDIERFDQDFFQEEMDVKVAKVGAGRILINLLKRIAPEANPSKIEKTSLEHGNNVIVVNQEYLQKDKKDRVRIMADGLITNLSGIPIMVMAADCAPVGIYDPKNQAIGAFHSGWRGTLKQISLRGIEKMVKEYGSRPEELLVAIGPYAGGQDYEVSSREYTQFQEAQDEEGNLLYSQEEINTFFQENKEKPGHYFLDIGEAIRLSLVKVGILPEQIQLSQYSTMSQDGNALFSSERKEGREGRDASVFMMVLK